MYKEASRVGLRFNCDRGVVTTEDLWNLPETELDEIYRELSSMKRSSESDSLLEANETEDKTLELKLGIVKDVFETKREERDAAKRRTASRMRKQRILEIIHNKKDADLQDKTLEELEAMLDEDAEEG